MTAMGLDVIELVMAIETEFGVAIPDQVAAELCTGRATTEYLVDVLRVRAMNGLSVPAECLEKGEVSDERVWRMLRKLVAEQAGRPEEDVNSDQHFVNDLGMG